MSSLIQIAHTITKQTQNLHSYITSNHYIQQAGEQVNNFLKTMDDIEKDFSKQLLIGENQLHMISGHMEENY